MSALFRQLLDELNSVMWVVLLLRINALGVIEVDYSVHFQSVDELGTLDDVLQLALIQFIDQYKVISI